MFLENTTTSKTKKKWGGVEREKNTFTDDKVFQL